MNPSTSTSAGVSLNFDAQALHNQEEAEYEREEQLRERELRDLLTQAFDDDLSDDEEGSVASTGATSNDESDHPDRQQVIQSNSVAWGTPGLGDPGHMYPASAHTSTPLHPHAPPLSTPAPTPYSGQPLPPGPGVAYQGGGGEYLQYPTHDLDRPSHPHEWDPHAQYYQPHPQQHQGHLPVTTDPGPLAYLPPHQYPETEYGLREEAEGGPDGLVHHVYDSGQQHQDPQHQHYFTQPTAQTTGPQPEITGPYHGPQHQQPEPHPYFPPTHDYTNNNQNHSPHRPQLQAAGSREDLLAAPTTPDYPRPYLPYGGEAQGSPGAADLEGYKVKYFGSSSADKPEQDHRQGPAGAAVPQPALLLPDHGGKDVNTPQHDFLNQGGASDSRQLGQLQILYTARGQKIEELTQEVQALRDDSDREIRILKHKLALTQDERDGLEESLKQSQALVTETHRKEAEVQGKANALEAQVAALQQSKEELVKKLQTAESTIESLNAQLCELESSESLARSRDQHDNIVTGLQHKYESEIYDLKQRLDKANQENDTKSQEIENLRKRVEGLLKAAEEGQIERADSINRLTRTVEDSQKQCQQLLEAGTGQELSKLKVHLQEVIAGKSIAEDMNTALAEELQEMKEQVMMYESASQYGVLPLGSSTSSTPHPGGATNTAMSADDSYLQLGIKSKGGAEDTGSGGSTPRADMADGSSLHTEQTLHGLKKELERCLTMYRAKRQQVAGLQEELRATRHSLEDVGARLEEAQHGAEESARRLAEYEAEVGPLGGAGVGQETVQERRLQRQIDSLSRDKRMLDEEVKELMARIEEIAENEDKVKEANRELSHQMSEMVREYDDDKRQALELCESTLMEHHERVKAQLEADLRDELNQDREKITRDYEQQIEDLRQELDSTQSELDEVKEMYITVSQTKEQIRENTDQLWVEKMESKLAEVREAFTKEKEEEIEKFKSTWASNNDAVLSSDKEKWLQEQEDNVKTQVDEQVTVRKADWLREHAAAKDTAVAAALVTAEASWKDTWDVELQKTLTEKLAEAKETWTLEKEQEFSAQLALRVQRAGSPTSPSSPPALTESTLTRRLEEAHHAWSSTELPRALEEAKQTWRETELRAAVEEAKEEARAAASQSTQQLDTSQDLKTAVAGMLSEAKAQWLEEQRQDVEATVARVTQAAQEEADQRVEEATQQVKQEITELHAAKLQLAAEERADLLAAKDAERREAVVSAQNQSERDYREFLAEHQDTLNKALRTAREQFAREKAEIERKHDEEMKGFREREAKASQLELQYSKEKAELEEKWQVTMAEVSKKHAEEKDTMMRTHRDNLLKALEEARSRWQQKYEEALEENNMALLEEKEATWVEERVNFQAEIDILKAEAAEHQDSLAKLRGDMDATHKRELSQLVASQQNELATNTADMRQQLDVRSAEMERLSGEVRECVAGLEEAQRVAAEEAQELRAAISQRDAEIARLKAELTASEERVESSETNNKDVIRRLESMQKQTDRLERDRQEVEGQKEQLTVSFQGRHAELVEQLQRADRKLKGAEANTQKQIALVQESLEREHTVVMEKMKAKMVELRSNHIVAVDNLRKQHNAEKNEWRQHMAEQERNMTHTPTQTDGATIEASALSEMGNRYLVTVTKMRSEVLRHVNDSNTRAAETVREQIIKERQTTARRLRRYYMKCLNHLLDAEGQQMTREEKLAYMEQALEYIPSRDTSQMTSASSGPRSNVTTPDDLTMTTTATTSTNNTPKGNTSRSRVDFHSPNRTKEKRTRVKDVVDSSLQTRVKTLVENYTCRDMTDPRDDVTPYSRGGQGQEHVSRSQQRKSGSGSSGGASGLVTQSLDRHVTHKRSTRVEVPRLDLSQVHGTSLDGHMPQNDRANGTHHTSPPRRPRQTYQSHSSWDSEVSSGDNAHHSGYYRTQDSRAKDSPSSGHSSQKTHESRSNNSTSRHKYLSSKSAEHFSIEKPRSSRSKTKHSDSVYDLDIEMPSVHKSQSTTCLEHSTPRGQYLANSEPRKYYDVDFGTFREAQLQPVRDAACGSTTPLTKVNSETYLLTPMGLQSGMHGSMSMGDVRDMDETDQSLTESKPMCYSDDGLLNCDMETAGRSYSKSRQSSQPASPQKSTSMPNVARPDRWTATSNRTNTHPYDYSDREHAQGEDSGESTLSDSVNHRPQATTRAGHQNSNSGVRQYSTKPYRNIYGNGLAGKKEQQHHVVFKNVETHCEDDESDNESVKSFLSTSSVSDFRAALKTKQAGRGGSSSREEAKSQGVPSHSAKKPLKVMPPSEHLQSMLAQVPDNVHRPVAMVTRHTQVPSPRPVYKQPRHYNSN